jgi:hypothetical protein
MERLVFKMLGWINVKQSPSYVHALMQYGSLFYIHSTNNFRKNEHETVPHAIASMPFNVRHFGHYGPRASNNLRDASRSLIK